MGQRCEGQGCCLPVVVFWAKAPEATSTQLVPSGLSWNLMSRVGVVPLAAEIRRKALAVAYPVGAENRVTLCDLQVLVEEAAEPVSSEHADGGPGFWRDAACGRSLIQ